MAKRNDEAALRENDRLSARLIDYSAITRVSSGVRSLRRRTGSWPIYAAAAGSALAMATSASADIITCLGNCTENVPSGFDTVSTNGLVHLEGKATTNNLFGLRAGKGKQVSNSITYINGFLDVFGSNNVKLFFTGSVGNPKAQDFAAGAPIGPAAGSHWGSRGLIDKKFATASVGTGNFVASQAGFVGVQVQGDLYGWVKLVFTINDNIPSALTVISWDLDTNPNQAINAGQDAAASTPEPGSMGLALLAAGAAGVLALRRRKPVPATE